MSVTSFSPSGELILSSQTMGSQPRPVSRCILGLFLAGVEVPPEIYPGPVFVLETIGWGIRNILLIRVCISLTRGQLVLLQVSINHQPMTEEILHPFGRGASGAGPPSTIRENPAGNPHETLNWCTCICPSRGV